MSGFDAKSFYRFSNDVYPGNTLSAGVFKDSNGDINMTIEGTFSSSENWQIYYQQGRYFLRNYDYGGDWQLGLDDNAKAIPRMMRRSGALGQQWTLTQGDEGKWTFTNGMLGNGSWFALVGTNTIPGMQPSRSGNEWEITINPSAGNPPEGNMMEDVDNFEEPPPTSTSSISSSLPAGSPTGSATLSSTTFTSTQTGISAPAPSSSSGSTLSTGAIAGIAVGGVALLAAIGFLAFFFWRRKQKPNPYVENPPQELATTEKPTELGSPSQPEPMIAYKHQMRPVEIG